jgi:hypothetical protein
LEEYRVEGDAVTIEGLDEAHFALVSDRRSLSDSNRLCETTGVEYSDFVELTMLERAYRNHEITTERYKALSSLMGNGAPPPPSELLDYEPSVLVRAFREHELSQEEYSALSGFVSLSQYVTL